MVQIEFISLFYDSFVHSFIHFYCQTTTKSIDQIDLLREQQKILSGEVALHSSALKRLSEEAAKNPHKDGINVILLYPYHLCLQMLLIFLGPSILRLFCNEDGDAKVKR